jgi:hypothetical protein
MIRALGHVQSNAIAYLALCVSVLALAGGAYAAFTLPANSVGARQIRDGSIGPQKLDHGLIGGTIRHWAQLNALGQVVSSSGGAREQEQPGADGQYLISWGRDTFSKRCTVIASVVETPGLPRGGFTSTWAFPGATGMLVHVDTFNPQGVVANEPFSIAVIC